MLCIFNVDALVTELHVNTLRFITRTEDGRMEFIPGVRDLWNELGSLWRDDWFVAVGMEDDDPCAIVLTYDEETENESQFDEARLLVYYFLRALMYRAISDVEKKIERESHILHSKRIQMSFVKFLCFAAANSTETNLQSVDLNLKSVVFVGHVEDNRYMAGCILCPKIDRRTVKDSIEVAATSAVNHFRRNHLFNRKRSCGSLCDRRAMNESLTISLPTYLIEIQKTIACQKGVLGRQCLNVEHVQHWFRMTN